MTTQTIAMIGLVSFGWLAVFQLLLAAGLPLGHLAWGGAHRVLPAGRRLASLISAGIAGVGGLAVAQGGGLIAGPLNAAWLTPVLWAFAGFFGLSVLLNLLGARGLERLQGVPLAGLCAGSCLMLALP